MFKYMRIAGLLTGIIVAVAIWRLPSEFNPIIKIKQFFIAQDIAAPCVAEKPQAPASAPVDDEPSVAAPELIEATDNATAMPEPAIIEQETSTLESEETLQHIPEEKFAEPTDVPPADIEITTPPAHRHYFWQPFTTRSKAQGFAGRVTELSGVTCTAEQQEPQGYRVYFEYRTEDEWQQAIARIESSANISLQDSAAPADNFMLYE